MSFSLYGLLVGTGFALCLWQVEKRLQSVVPEKALSWLPIWVAVGALAGARIYHLGTDWHLYTSEPFWKLFAVWEGGLGIFGALLGGVATILLWKRFFHLEVSPLQLTDAFSFGLPWAQAVGRWGNFVNQELFGTPTNLPWGLLIDEAHRPAALPPSTRFHPLFLYESALLLLLGGALHLLYKKKSPPVGALTSLYLVGSGVIRFALEFLRYESARGPVGLTVAQWMSLGIVFAGVLLLAWTQRRSLQ